MPLYEKVYNVQNIKLPLFFVSINKIFNCVKCYNIIKSNKLYIMNTFNACFMLPKKLFYKAILVSGILNNIFFMPTVIKSRDTVVARTKCKRKLHG